MAASPERVITVFVSSTFVDMQAERDHLVKIVFPKLRRVCSGRGVIFGEVDLRWGITEQERAEGRILPICLQEIDRCRPYFIGLLGGRYGHVPPVIPEEILQRAPWLAACRQCSITELEIQHGVLRALAPSTQAYFYFRGAAGEAPPRPENEEAARKLERLKDEIRERHSRGLCRLREGFRSARELGTWVEEDFNTLIDSLFPPGVQEDPLERESSEHRRLAQAYCLGYVTRPVYFQRLDRRIEDSQGPLVICGPDGSGKTALLANWWLRREAGGVSSLLAHFASASGSAIEWPAMLRRLLSEFNRRFDLQVAIPDDHEQLRVAFANTLGMIPAEPRFAILLDGVDEMEEFGKPSDLNWLPRNVPNTIRLIVSTRPGRTHRILAERNWQEMSLEPLQPGERLKAVWRYLRTYRKRLSKDLRRKLALAEPCSNPLYLRAILDELRLHGQAATLRDQIDNYLSAGDGTRLFEKILERSERDYGSERPGLVQQAMSLLSASRNGLTEVELLELLAHGQEQRLPQVIWSEMRLGLAGALAERSGRFQLGHAFIREAVRRRYFENDEQRRAAHHRLAVYFEHTHLSRRAQQLPWQAMHAGDWELLKAALSDFALVEEVHSSDGPQRLVEYWVALRDATGCEPAQVYRNSWKQAQAEGTGLRGAASVLGNLGWADLAEEIVASEVGRLRRRPGELRRLASELMGYSQFFMARNDLVRATALVREAIAVWESLGEAREAARSRMDLAGLLVGPDPHQALRLLEAVLDEAVRSADLTLQAAALGNLANVWWRLGDLNRALNYCEKAVALCAVRGDVLAEAEHKDSLAALLRRQGKRERALEMLKDSEQVYRRLGTSGPLGRCLGQQALLLQDMALFSEALSKNLEAEAHLAGSGQKIWHATCVLASAFLCRTVSNRALGLEKANLALALLKECNAPAGMLAQARELASYCS